MEASAAPRASVVIATFNRLALLRRLLENLADQSLPPADYEVVVVDDGSREPVRPALGPQPYVLRVEEQANAGAATARNRGALAARGGLLIFVDDDMQVGRGFVEAHLELHGEGRRRVVLGQIRPPPQLSDMALHERWHQHHLDQLAARSKRGEHLPGNSLYTGNLSLRRSDYVTTGGFDLSFRHVEDGEFGLRLEKAGLEILVGEEAYTLNNGDRPSAEAWRRRAHVWGIHEVRIARKHADLRHASPWRFLGIMNPLARPIPLVAALLPGAAQACASVAYALARAADGAGLERLALTATGLTFCFEYFRGVRDELGGAGRVVSEATRYLLRMAPGAAAPEKPAHP